MKIKLSVNKIDRFLECTTKGASKWNQVTALSDLKNYARLKKQLESMVANADSYILSILVQARLENTYFKRKKPIGFIGNLKPLVSVQIEGYRLIQFICNLKREVKGELIFLVQV